uniref:tRNA_edit domain-containing protein n=1 Tax=Panagrellus redivivus TaxID=6233 RepID=A0A7E4UR88_PANRE
MISVCTVSLKIILNSFKNLDFVYLGKNYAYENWIKDALTSGKRDMEKLKIDGRFQELFSFTPAELEVFFERQDDDFHLMLRCNDRPNNALKLLRQNLGAHFEEIEKDNLSAGVLVVTVFDDSKYTMIWFQVKGQRHGLKRRKLNHV